MAVAVSATSAAAYNASAATQNFTFATGPASGDTLAIFYIAQDATQTITSVTWDQGGTNQACTLIGSEPCSTAANGKIYLYGVVNPTAGASKVLRVVNGTATAVGACMQSYKGTITSSVAAACTNALVANGTGSAAAHGTAAQSGSSGDMYISGYVAGVISAVSNTSIFLLQPSGDDSAGNRVASTGASVSLTATTDTSNWAAVSCCIKQSGLAITGAVLTDSAPTLGAPAFNQKDVLATTFLDSAPTLGAPVLTNILTASSLSDSAPILDAPVFTPVFFTTIYAPTNALNTTGGGPNLTFRVLCLLSASSSGKLQVTFTSAVGGTLSPPHCSISKWDGSGAPSATTVPIELKFGGVSGFSISDRKSVV